MTPEEVSRYITITMDVTSRAAYWRGFFACGALVLIAAGAASIWRDYRLSQSVNGCSAKPSLTHLPGDHCLDAASWWTAQFDGLA